jgi:hemerythrin
MEMKIWGMETNSWEITWNDGMSVGIPEIDADHKRFICLVNKFNLSVADRGQLTDVKGRIQDILEDAVQHFAHEKRLFKEWHYPDAEDHARIHTQIIQALKDIKEIFLSYGLYPEWIEAGLKIKDVLMNHIMTEDMKYAAYYQSNIANR